MQEFTDVIQLKAYITQTEVIDVAMQGLDLTQIEKTVLKTRFEKCLFLGCTMNNAIRKHLFRDNYIFPKLDVKFLVYPSELYNEASLYNGYEYKKPDSINQTYDSIVYKNYIEAGKVSHDIKETLARRLHDHSITDALQEFLGNFNEKKCVAIMGGHGLSRDSEMFLQIAILTKSLTEDGYLMISGGGPGAMEATHLGAWFAGRSSGNLAEAISILKAAPLYNHKNWLPTAFKVMDKFPGPGGKSLGIPTWLYGYEPATPFASDIAKYFANSVREEGLLAIAKGGVIFAPGSAGTMQEIFQDICQNHYQSFSYSSPMIFLDKKYWSYERPLYPIIELMQLRGQLKNLLITHCDSNEEVVKFLKKFK